MALDREAKLRQLGPVVTGPQTGIAANAERIWESAMVRTTAAGYLVKVNDGTVTATGPVTGIARFTAAGGTTDGEYSLDTYQGVFARPNSSTAPVTQKSFGRTIYAEDDEKVCSDPSLPVAGTMWGFTEDGLVIFAIDPSNSLRATGSLASAPIPLASFYELDGTPLAAFVGGISAAPGLSLNDSECAGIRWNNDAAPDGIVASLPVPTDLDPARPSYVMLTAAKVGATPADVPTFTIGAFQHPVGSTYDAGADLGGATAAMADLPTKTVQGGLAVAIAVDAIADPSSGTNTLTVTVTPEAGKLGTDDLVLISARLLYTPKI